MWQGSRHIIGPNDVVVFGEYSRKIYEYLSTSVNRAKSIYFCQNHNGFHAVRKPYGKDRMNPEMNRRNTDSIMVVSHVSKAAIARHISDIPIEVLPPEIADGNFKDQGKCRQIAYMPRKRRQESEQIDNLFRSRHPNHNDVRAAK